MVRVLCCVLCVLVSQALGQSGGAWIDAIPEPQRAIEKISGDSELDTKSRQGAALYAITQLILRMSGNEFRNPPRLSARESALLESYGAFYQSFSLDYAAHLNRGLSPERLEELGRNRPSTPFADLEYRYRNSRTFQREVFTLAMGQAWVEQWYEPLVARETQQAEAARAQMQQGLDLLNANAQRSREAAAQRRREAMLRIALGLVVMLAGIGWTILTWRSTRLDARDPFIVTGRRAGWTLAACTGLTTDSRVYTTTTRHTTRERFNDHRPDVVRSHDVHTSHREFVVHTAERAYPFHLRNSNLLVGDGHVVSCAWPEKGRKTRDHLLLINHTTQVQQVSDGFVAPLFLPGWLIAIGVGIAMHWIVGLLVLMLVAAAWKVVKTLQTRRFNQQDLSRLISVLNTRAAEVAHLTPAG
ncbi:MAG: hypothetical protein KF757_11770 [Phycisphaeraceae bacterium]|nr:hypothetical protein [Phycisphaeraceae bacterium]